MKHIAFVGLVLVAGCNAPSAPEWLHTGTAPSVAALDTMPVETLDETPPPPPPANAVTVDQFDTTTAEDRAEALAVTEPAGEQRLGETLATLGSPADPGIWLETGLVTVLTPGRVEVVATGASVNLELRPSGGDPDAGSEISLPAMRLLELPFTAIEPLAVFALPFDVAVN